MEEVLDTSHAEYDTTHPRICMDEAAKQVQAYADAALPLAPGRPWREDHHHARQGGGGPTSASSTR